MRGGANLPKIRDYNQSLVLEIIRVTNGISRTEIAERTGLRARTVSNIVKRLINLGLISERGREASDGMGKPRMKLEVNPGGAYAVGVQIDRDETSFVLLDLAGKMVERTQHPTLEEGPTEVLGHLTNSIGKLVSRTDISPAQVLGVGVACPGPLDHLTGVVHETPNLPWLRNVPLRRALEEKTGYPVIVDRDATAAAIGEHWAGGNHGARNFAFVHVGSGIGAGLFIEDQVYRGTRTIAGAIGHTTLNPDGPKCFCGNRGCVDVYCAPKATVLKVTDRLARGDKSALQNAFQKQPETIDFEAICRAALAKDAVCLQELRRSAWLLGCAIVNLVTTVDIELVVLGGTALRKVERIYQREIERALQERLLASKWRSICVKPSKVGEDAGAVGAASLVLHAAHAPILEGLKGTSGSDSASM